MDRQIKAELAWLIPYRLLERSGSFDFDFLRSLSLPRLESLMTEPEPLHRFPRKMARNLHAAIILIGDKYAGDASAIWSGKPPSALVVYRFLEFQGVGPKIATMAVNILARHLKVQLSDYYSVDISVDTHVRRVLRRLGLIQKAATAEEIIYLARSLHPEFPGIIDYPLWEIGRNWCSPRSPDCRACYLCDLCPSAVLNEPLNPPNPSLDRTGDAAEIQSEK
jgi:endonuclease III